MNLSETSSLLLLVRHGETDANASGVWQGATDSPLNARGQAQAQAVAAQLAAETPHVAAIYTSPLSRARATAEIIASQLGVEGIITDPDLAEFHLGEWEGISYDLLRHEKKLWDRMNADPTFAPPGGESALAFASRLLRAGQHIAARHPGQTVVVVGHGGALATLMALAIEGKGHRWPVYTMANCAISELRWGTPASLTRFNDVGHLRDDLSPQNWGKPGGATL